ncbi:MAG: cation diffusion facilitator family transporter [Planctomycetota bacterium]|jgi:cation diffusion facilitator family transporter
MISQNDKRKLSAARLSLIVGAMLTGAKFLAWRLTGSSAVLSDAAESIINVFAAAFAYFAIHVSAMPADENHPYGHGKVEFFSAGFEGALIVGAALVIMAAAIPALFLPPEISEIGLGMAITGLAAVVNAVLGLYLIRVGKESRSLAIEADGVHLITDVVTSAGVIVSLLAVQFTGLNIIDPIIAILLGANILVSGYKLVRSSVGQLLDEADEEVLGEIVETLNKTRQPGDLQPHQLRARRAGSRLSIDFHLFLPRFWELTQVHQRIDDYEDALKEAIHDDLEAIIHVDPCLPRHCSSCNLEGCRLRESDSSKCEVWDADHIRSVGAHPDFE